MNTTENNKLIAKFMALKLTTDGIQPLYYSVNNSLKALPKYHNDWNWLMEVVEKIEGLTTNVGFKINRTFCMLQVNNNLTLNSGIGVEQSKIEAVYNVVVQFIKWYNEQKIAE